MSDTIKYDHARDKRSTEVGGFEYQEICGADGSQGNATGDRNPTTRRRRQNSAAQPKRERKKKCDENASESEDEKDSGDDEEVSSDSSAGKAVVGRGRGVAAGQSRAERTRPEDDSNPGGGDVPGVAVVGAAAGLGALAAPVVAQAALGFVGFSSTGVVGGTLAAAIQSSIGSVAAGSWFAGAQSIAMGGAFPPLGFAISAIVAGSWVYGAIQKQRQVGGGGRGTQG